MPSHAPALVSLIAQYLNLGVSHGLVPVLFSNLSTLIQCVPRHFRPLVLPPLTVRHPDHDLTPLLTQQ